MKRIIVFLALIYSQCLLAATPPDNSLKACHAYENKCVAVGEIPYTENCNWWNGCYKIVSYISLDGEKTWTETNSEQSSHAMQNLSAIKCSQNLDRCAVVGSENDGHDRIDSLGFILFSNDGGYHWKSKRFMDSGTDICWPMSPYWANSLASVDTDFTGKHWVAVGSCTSNSSMGFLMTGYAVVSFDDGETWRYSSGQPMLADKDFVLYNVTCSKFHSCRANGTITIEWPQTEPVSFISKNVGDHWTLVTNPKKLHAQNKIIH